jgi:hypothetical protein
MRISSAAALLLPLAACSSEASVAPSADPDDLIECALAGAAAFARDCAVERNVEEGSLYLVVRHPDGGFRRFEVLRDGRALASADGADQAQIELRGEGIEVAVGADRYRFPATIAGDDRR